MNTQHPNSPAACDWFKSTYSSGAENCLESANDPLVVPVRDSKVIDGPILKFSHGSWAAFVDSVKRDRFNGIA